MHSRDFDALVKAIFSGRPPSPLPIPIELVCRATHYDSEMKSASEKPRVAFREPAALRNSPSMTSRMPSPPRPTRRAKHPPIVV